MAILRGDVEARAQQMKLEYQRELERYKRTWQHELDLASVKQEGVAYILKMTAAQRLEREAEAAEKQLRVKRLQSAALACTLSTAVNLWIVKHGDGWVAKQDVTNDTGEMDWQALGRRLSDANRMEEYEDYWRIIT